jgi:hypothetical protein
VYARSKDKNKKKGKKGGKEAGKELAKKVMNDERALRDPVGKLALLLLEVPFKPIKRTAQMHKGQESIEVVNEENHCGLVMGKEKGTLKLKEATRGPLSLAKNKSGLNLVRATLEKAAAIVTQVEKAKTKHGQINAHVLKSLEKPADELQKLISALGATMKIQNLRRLVTVPIERAPAVGPVEFPVSPARLLAKAKKRSKPNPTLYRDSFIEELRRQVRLQSEGLNRISVDEWVININLYSMNRDRFLAMDHTARIEVLEELKRRAEEALETTRTRQAELNTALEATKRALAATRAGQNIAPLKASVAEVAGRTGQEIVHRERLERETREAMKKAQMTEQEQVNIFERILKDQAQWAAIAASGSEIVILHNPDQVGGGYDAFEQPPDPPKNPRDANEWKEYIKKLLKHVGPRDVNSKIGGYWRLVVSDAYRRVTAVVPQQSYRINRMNLPLEVKVT